MITSSKEFARIWKKDPDELTQLDYFIFLLINELGKKLKIYFKPNPVSEMYRINEEQVSELVVQIGDGLQFFYEQMCFGKGCSLGCPNKLDTPFSKNEDEMRLAIIEQEFDGNASACSKRKHCLQHDLNTYVVKDTLTDFYTYNMNLECAEEEPILIRMANFITTNIIRFTNENGSELLKEPYKKRPSF